MPAHHARGMYLAVLTNPRQRDTYIETTTGFIQFPPTLSSSTRAVNGRDVSRRVEFKRRFKFSREIPRSLNFAPRFDPSFSFPFRGTTAFSKRVASKKEKRKREKSTAGCFVPFHLFPFFNRYFISNVRVYMYICMRKGILFCRKFPNFSRVFQFLKEGEMRASARVICSINALRYNAPNKILTRCSKLKIMHRKYITRCPKSYSFPLFRFRFGYSYRRINW